MIKFSASFKVFSGEHVGVPKTKKHGENFWCSFNTTKQLIMCNVVYLGDDEIMQQNKSYNGIIELPYGEKFPPYGNEFSEAITIAQNYYLSCGADTIGECNLLNCLDLKNDDWDIKHTPDGNY